MGNNIRIRDAARKNKVKHWEIAYAPGVSESVLCRKLRRELPADEADKILEVVERISKEKEDVQHE